MLKISFNVNQLKRELAEKLKEETMTKLELTAELALAELKLNTPKKTGAAANSWEINFEKDSVVFTNDKDYIKQLNSGSSKQAPANFIESTLLNYGKPKGPIVTYE
jgi:hypothetical protein